MLKTLEHRPQTEQAKILTAAVDQLLPQALPEAERKREYSEAVAELLSEIQRTQKLKPTAKNVKAVLFQVLSGELKRVLLDDAETKAARSRLGQRGDLPAPQYRVVFDENFRYGPRSRGITRTYVENTIHSPDGFQHLLTERSTDRDSVPAVSLFVKRHANKTRPQDSYVLLVQTQRSADSLHVNTAWSIYPADVDITNAKTPLDMLTAFVGKYGLEFYIGDGFCTLRGNSAQGVCHTRFSHRAQRGVRGNPAIPSA
jgi:hypothetical protein